LHPFVHRQIEPADLDRAGEAQPLFHRRDAEAAAAAEDRQTGHDARVAQHHVITARGFEERAYVLLCKARQVLPGLEASEFSIWMGFRPSFPDSLPVIDEAPGRRGLFLAFGHGRHTGMTGGAPTARLIKQLVAGEPAARNWLAQTSLAASVGGVNHPVEQGSSVSLSGDGNTAIVRQLQASINLALGSASQQAPHWRGRRNCDCDSLTWTVEASASAVAQRSSGNSDSVRGPG